MVTLGVIKAEVVTKTDPAISAILPPFYWFGLIPKNPVSGP